jgi:OOP family OmpA-OmpF porin
MIQSVRLGLCVALLAVLGACAGAFTAEDNLDAARGVSAPEGTFNEFLRQEYIEQSQISIDEYDYRSGDIFARKALAAGGGEMVLPEDPANWKLSAEKASELSASRGMLLEALDGGGRDAAPADAAHAQAMFDCWVEEEAEGHEPDDIAACRDGFWSSLAKVLDAIKPQPAMEEPAPPPEPPARDYLVFFDFDKTDVRADSASILNRVISAIGELSSGSVTLVGHADTSGPATYNQGLSEDRAVAVRNYLLGKGVTADISTSGRGEEDPRVATPDNVREQENRRVEIRVN